MGLSNLATRNKAIPFRATPWNIDLYLAFGNRDYSQLNGGLIRFCRPFAGDIITSKLTIIGTAPTGGTTYMRFYKGDFNADGTTAVTSYSEERIAADHLAITGQATPLTFTAGSQLLVDGMDLRRIIPAKGDSDYNEDGFILGVEITGGATPSTYQYREFKLDCTTQMGVL